MDIICCSLEPWDDVWRRNQFFASELLDLDPTIRLLFVEIGVDMIWSAIRREQRRPAGLRSVGGSGRLWALTPRKWMPRRVWPYVDRSLGRKVRAAARQLGFEKPILWINDNNYADLVVETGWSSVYDVTDDWLLGAASGREATRQRRNDAKMLQYASEVIVCSPALSESRGATREVHLITNGVDVEHIRRYQERPTDLPMGRTVVYLGTVTAGRVDLPLCVALGRELTDLATLVFVGPASLTREGEEQLRSAGAVLLGSRPYDQVPGYLQHADVLIVPHLVNAFTESLDPIKARELLALGRPTVSTPVAGFRGLGPPVTVADAESFGAVVTELLMKPAMPPGPGPMVGSVASWSSRAREFMAVLQKASSLR